MPVPDVVTAAVRAVVPRSARNWLRDPRGTLQWGLDQARFALGRVEELEIRPGWTVRAHPLAVRCAFRAQIDDPLQRAELDGFLARCTPGMRLLDVGAHFGIFSLAALQFGGPDARAVAVDPSGTATSMIALHAQLNGCVSRLEAIRACAASTPGERAMLDTGVIGAGYFVSPDSRRRAGDLSPVRAVSIDGLCESMRFRPTHLKIDVEGDELDVLQGAEGLLTGADAPIVFLELHDAILSSRGKDPRDVLAWLDSRGYAFDVAPAQQHAVRRLVAVRQALEAA